MKKSDLLIIFIAIVFVIVVFALFTPVITEQSRLQDEISALSAEKEQIRNEISSLQKEIADLQSGDARAINRVAREKFNYCREGEEVYRLEYIPIE